MSSPPVVPMYPFDVVLGGAPLVEEIVAAELLSGLPCVPSKGLVVDEAFCETIRDKRVLVCGSYLTISDLFLISFSVKTLDVWVYSDNDVSRYQNGGLTSDHIRGQVERFTMAKFKDFPSVTRLLRRTLDPSHEECANDEAFYRGVTHRSLNHTDAITHLVRGIKPGQGMFDKTYIETGRMIVETQADVAKNAVKAGSIEVLRGNLKLRIMVGLCTIVMPVANEAAHDVDIGVVVRYDLVKKTTMLTFVTHNATDLAFVEKSPWNGGGRDGCKGCTLQGLRGIADVIEMCRS